MHRFVASTRRDWTRDARREAPGLFFAEARQDFTSSSPRGARAASTTPSLLERVRPRSSGLVVCASRCGEKRTLPLSEIARQAWHCTMVVVHLGVVMVVTMVVLLVTVVCVCECAHRPIESLLRKNAPRAQPRRRRRRDDDDRQKTTHKIPFRKGTTKRGEMNGWHPAVGGRASVREKSGAGREKGRAAAWPQTADGNTSKSVRRLSNPIISRQTIPTRPPPPPPPRPRAAGKASFNSRASGRPRSAPDI